MLYNNIGLLLACVNINYVYDNPGLLTCDCVRFNDECFEDGRCIREDRCPESDRQPTGNNLQELRISKLILQNEIFFQIILKIDLPSSRRSRRKR